MKIIVKHEKAIVTYETKDKAVHQKTLERYKDKPHLEVIEKC